mgnify:CR=1 FL=1
MNDFQQWLLSQSIDCQTLTTELENSLRNRFEAEQPVEQVLLIPIDCSWPQRAFWQPTGQ